MRHPGDDRQDHLRHLQPGQPGRPHRHPHLGHLRPHLDQPPPDHRGLDCRAEMGPHGTTIISPKKAKKILKTPLKISSKPRRHKNPYFSRHYFVCFRSAGQSWSGWARWRASPAWSSPCWPSPRSPTSPPPSSSTWE